MAERIEPVIGIVGGSGLYDIDGLAEKVWRSVETPWGPPSDALRFGRLAGVSGVSLPRPCRGLYTPMPSQLFEAVQELPQRVSGRWRSITTRAAEISRPYAGNDIAYECLRVAARYKAAEQASR